MARAFLERSNTPEGTSGDLRNWLSYSPNDHFWRGYASAFEAFGRGDRLYYYVDPWEADYLALRGDWEAIGFDMHRAVRQFETDHAEELAGQERLFNPDRAS